MGPDWLPGTAHDANGRSPSNLSADRPRYERQIAHEGVGRSPIPWCWLR
jgi:hypothetical protein